MLRLSQSLVFCGFVVCLPVGCTGVVGESVQTVASTPDKELLTRFVNECVTIEPGKEPFPGQFQIGSQDEGEAALPPAIVEMRTKFRISKFEVTQDLYESVMGMRAITL